MQNKVTIATAKSGFYQGFNTTVAIAPKIIIFALLAWTIFYAGAAEVLEDLQLWTTSVFAIWYMWSAAFFTTAILLLAAVPATGNIKLGSVSDRPEFSRFSWFAMMFGAGIGIGMLTYSTAEPIYHFATNPDVILGAANAQGVDNVRHAFKWGLFHWGLTPWAIYAVLGIALAYFSYNKGLPLTIRSGLYPLFGNTIAGPIGHVVDVVAILATIIGVAVTIGFGVSQLASGLFNISGAQWLMDSQGSPTFIAQISALIFVIIASTFSALSGLKRGIKWLSNINMGLTVFILLFFVVFGALAFSITSFGLAIWDYLTALPAMSLTIWDSESAPELATWQSDWTIFYWAWWIAFAPFVGLFLARVSKGRTIREYVVGAMIVPSLTCLTWFALVGGTALDLELSGIANGRIMNADISSQLYATINLLLSPLMAKAMSLVVVILLLTYLITSVDSAILIVTTLASAGKHAQRNSQHIVIWALIFAAVIAALLSAGGMGALRSAMIIGALPFSFVMMLLMLSLLKALILNR